MTDKPIMDKPFEELLDKLAENRGTLYAFAVCLLEALELEEDAIQYMYEALQRKAVLAQHRYQAALVLEMAANDHGTTASALVDDAIRQQEMADEDDEGGDGEPGNLIDLEAFRKG